MLVAPLEFGFQDMANEVDALDRLVGDFCAPQSTDVLRQLRGTLESIRDSPSDREWRWGIPESNPFVTAVSYGSYQPGSQGQHNVFAEITSTWTIRRLRPPRRRGARAGRFALTGKASTRVRLRKVGANAQPSGELAMWRAEVADAVSPGCHFHVQVLGEADNGQFPHSLDVPRLPALITTPPGVIEYVLSELFQEDWAHHLASRGADLNRWVPIQRQRLGALLRWQYGLVVASSESPWLRLKREKPDADLFLGELQRDAGLVDASRRPR